MQQHSGEHIFSGLVHSTYGFDNVGFHLSDNEVTLDFNGVIGPDGIRDIERRANEIITRNIPSEIRFLSGEEAKTAEYRSKIDLDDEIRVVTYPGVDACACCARSSMTEISLRRRPIISRTPRMRSIIWS